MPQIELRLFGSFQALRGSAPISGFNSDKTRALLAYLAVEFDRPHRRESLAALLWPDVTEAAARQSLSQALSNLRRALGEADTPQPVILTDREAIQFNPKADCAVDVQRLLALANAVDGANVGDVLSVYRGPLLDGMTLPDADGFEEWLLLRRESLQRTALDVLDRHITAQTERGQFQSAITAAHRALEIDPWREETHRQLMLAYALCGQRSAALAQFEKCRQVLHDALGVDPSTETRRLHERIRSGAIQPTAPLDTVQPAPPAPPVTPAPEPAPRPTRPPSSLPKPPTPFVGRERELEQLGELLADPQVRLISLVGPGGMGKTRLAIELASHAASAAQISDTSTVYVSLVAIDSAELIPGAIAHAMGQPLTGNDALAELCAQLRNSRALVVLDNFEHVRLEGAQVVMRMLEEAPSVKCLITTREALQVSGEWVYAVGGLGDEAALLFTQAAQRARNGQKFGAAEQAAIQRICQLVDAMPLALEMAAAWVNVLPPDEIAAEIQRDLDFLATTARDLPERHRSMRAVFDHSYRMLNDDERQIMQRLAVFQGGFTREAARQVAGASLMALASLTAKSFIRRSQQGRYDAHELIRQFAVQQVPSAGELAAIKDNHLRYYHAFAQEAGPALNRPEQAQWFDLIEQEHGNIRAALEWAFADASASSAGRMTQGLELLCALHRFWQGRGHVSEAREWLEYGLRAPQHVPPAVQAAGYDILGWLAHHQADSAYAAQVLAKSLAAFTELNDATGISDTLDTLGDLAWSSGDLEQGVAHYTASLALRRNLPDQRAIAMSLYSLGRLYVDHKRNTEAAPLFDEALRMLERLGDQRGQALTINGMGRLAYNTGDMPQAKRHFERALAMFVALGNKVDIAECYEELALVAFADSDSAKAADLWAQGQALRREIRVQPLRYNEELAAPMLAAIRV